MCIHHSPAQLNRAASCRQRNAGSALWHNGTMETYLVGGAVRDQLLGREVSDRDFVVVGSTAQDMLDAGYRAVGKDFPVFLHPQSSEEYALARTERKTAPGYQGFEFDASTKVTLEEDLARRDLTINAIARGGDGNLVDPYGGVADIQARVLRHVSPAFVEDPVRVLRVARFMARFAPLGFRVAAATRELMQQMVRDGEVAHLVPERVWAEARKALAEPQPSAFLQTLRDCGALAVIFPEVDALYGVPQPAQYHPEIDTGVHIELSLDMAARLAPRDDLVGWCVLTHDLGKALTPDAELPSHIGHESHGVAPLYALAERLRVPVEHRDMAVLCCRYHLHAHRALELRSVTVLRLLERLDSFRRPQRLSTFLLVCEADARGRTGFADRDYPQAEYLRRCHQAAQAVSAAPFVAAGLEGEQIAEAQRRERIRVINQLRDDIVAS